MNRYEMVRLAQLVFALFLMFGAFLGGVLIGWLRWGRNSTPESTRRAPDPAHSIKYDLFSPAVETDDHYFDDVVVDGVIVDNDFTPNHPIPNHLDANGPATSQGAPNAAANRTGVSFAPAELAPSQMDGTFRSDL